MSCSSHEVPLRPVIYNVVVDAHQIHESLENRRTGERGLVGVIQTAQRPREKIPGRVWKNAVVTVQRSGGEGLFEVHLAGCQTVAKINATANDVDSLGVYIVSTLDRLDMQCAPVRGSTSSRDGIFQSQPLDERDFRGVPQIRPLASVWVSQWQPETGIPCGPLVHWVDDHGWRGECGRLFTETAERLRVECPVQWAAVQEAIHLCESIPTLSVERGRSKTIERKIKGAGAINVEAILGGYAGNVILSIPQQYAVQLPAGAPEGARFGELSDVLNVDGQSFHSFRLSIPSGKETVTIPVWMITRKDDPYSEVEQAIKISVSLLAE